jgi:putative nucleotidyltransferase with HDIG domain
MSKAKILIVEDERIIGEDIKDTLMKSGYSVSGIVSSGEKAIKSVQGNMPDLVLMDIKLQGDMDGIEAAKQIYDHYDIPIVFLTSCGDTETLNRVKAIELYGYVSKPFEQRELVTNIKLALCKYWIDKKCAKNEEDFMQSFDKSRSMLESTVSALASAIEMRDVYTAGHQARVTQLACAIAREMNFQKEEINGIRMAAFIHDIGKIKVPVEILNKPGQLNNVEFNMIKSHPQVGCEILKDVEFPWPIADIILQHHERLNGSGYPKRLRASNICLEAKILAVADVVEAMSSPRPYRQTHSINATLKEISTNKGVLYEPYVAETCQRLFKKQGFKFK